MVACVVATCFTELHSLGRRLGYMARKQRSHGLSPTRGKRRFSSPKRADQFWGTSQPLTEWVTVEAKPSLNRPGQALRLPRFQAIGTRWW
jgi:hypothetical protein